MFKRNFSIAVIIVSISLCGALSVHGEEGQCTQLLTTVCNNCHDSARICAKMDSPETKWQTVLEWMVSKGAKLNKGDTSLLANCLTESLEEARKVCNK